MQYDEVYGSPHPLWVGRAHGCYPGNIQNLPEPHLCDADVACKRTLPSYCQGEGDVMSTILLVILILLLIGALPTWPYSRSWGYYPSGGLGLIVVILLVLAVAGRL